MAQPCISYSCHFFAVANGVLIACYRQSLCQPGLRQGLCPTAAHAANVLLLVLADPTVLLRLLDLLELFCVRLQRSNGLVFEGYAPAAGKAPWTPAPNTTINYGMA